MDIGRRYRALKRELRRDLRELDVHPPLSAGDLCARLGQLRGRPIRMQAATLPAEVFGLWIPGTMIDYIVFQSQTTPLHQRHSQLHEFGHIYCGHRPEGRVELVDAMLRHGEFRTSASDDIRSSLARRTSPEDRVNGYGDEQEYEAELVATILMEWASVADYVTPRRSAHDDVNQIQTVLGERLGWQ